MLFSRFLFYTSLYLLENIKNICYKMYFSIIVFDTCILQLLFSISFNIFLQVYQIFFFYLKYLTSWKVLTRIGSKLRFFFFLVFYICVCVYVLWFRFYCCYFIVELHYKTNYRDLKNEHKNHWILRTFIFNIRRHKSISNIWCFCTLFRNMLCGRFYFVVANKQVFYFKPISCKK